MVILTTNTEGRKQSGITLKNYIYFIDETKRPSSFYNSYIVLKS